MKRTYVANANGNMKTFECMSLYDKINELVPGAAEDCSKDSNIYCVTTPNMRKGAEVLNYPRILDEILDDIGWDADGCYIFPSSIHEILLYKKSEGDAMGLEAMKEMVKGINKSVVSPEDKLDDNIRFFKDGVITVL